jgi:23S rRNA (guanine2445-N2)-methyltransferase / 23S rRNA (guanine2069-N7)-methyltransferase
MCGSGTLCIEAASIAADAAPGLGREYFGFLRWRGHDAALWSRLLDEARDRRAAARTEHLAIRGYDRDPGAVRAAQANAAAAGFERPSSSSSGRELGAADAPAAAGASPNPPYGERLGEQRELRRSVHGSRSALRERHLGWAAAVLTGIAASGASSVSRKAHAHAGSTARSNAALLRFDVDAKHRDEARASAPAEVRRGGRRGRPAPDVREPSAQELQGCSARGRAARASRASCVYDADMPEYAFS